MFSIDRSFPKIAKSVLGSCGFRLVRFVKSQPSPHQNIQSSLEQLASPLKRSTLRVCKGSPSIYINKTNEHDHLIIGVLLGNLLRNDLVVIARMINIQQPSVLSTTVYGVDKPGNSCSSPLLSR